MNASSDKFFCRFEFETAYYMDNILGAFIAILEDFNVIAFPFGPFTIAKDIFASVGNQTIPMDQQGVYATSLIRFIGGAFVIVSIKLLPD